jgi:hypothetical protein
MNRYLIVHRLRWPALLLLTGVIALLDQARILSWGHAWPLYLILFGVLALAERAVLASDPPPGYPYPGYTDPAYGGPGYPAAGFPGNAGPGPAQPAGPSSVDPVAVAPSTGIVPASGDLSLRRGLDEEGR